MSSEFLHIKVFTQTFLTDALCFHAIFGKYYFEYCLKFFFFFWGGLSYTSTSGFFSFKLFNACYIKREGID